MTFEKPQIMPEKREAMEPTEVLRYMLKLGQDISKQAEEVIAMLKEAEARGIEINIKEQVKKFEPLGELEVQMVEIRGKLSDLKSDMFNQGLKMTAEEMTNRLEEMKN